MVEQVTFNHWVTGSNPVPLTIIKGHCDRQVNYTCVVTMTFFLDQMIVSKSQVITVV